MMQAVARVVPWLAIVAFMVSIAYAIAPGPYTIAAFSLLAMPIYIFVLVAYVTFVLQDLRGRRVL